MLHYCVAALSGQSANHDRRVPLVCDTGTREHTNIERKIEIAGVAPKFKFGAGGRLLSRGIRFCSRWPPFLLAGGRLTSRGIRLCSRWPTFPLIENASDQAGNLQAGTFDRVSFHFLEDASRWPAPVTGTYLY